MVRLIIVFLVLIDASFAAEIKICSFNIQFLGNSRERDNAALAKIVKPFDVVVVQELVAPPCEGKFPDGSPFRPDAEAAEFFAAMKAAGFSYVLSEEDTGTGDTLHQNGSGTEWWVTFYKAGKVSVANDLPRGFLARDRSNHPDYERVPCAFPFRADGVDFVLISVHLQPGDSSKAAARRKHEFAAINRWVQRHDDVEKDFLILGDCNIKDADELADTLPGDFESLNDKCVVTNTNPKGPRPYDHVLFRPQHSTEVDRGSFRVIDLVKATGTKRYNHTRFRLKYSDHNPVVFTIRVPEKDDD